MSGGRRGWGLPAVSGVLLGLGYFNLPLPLPNAVAFLPLLAWLDARPRPAGRDVIRAGVVFGLSAHLLALHWIYSMLAISWLASLMYLALAAGFTLFITASVRLAAWIRERTGGSYGWILPVAWIPLEWLRTFGDLRMTADHLGHSVADHPFLVQCADLVGPYGVGAFVLAWNGFLFDATLARGRRRAPAAVALGLLTASVLGYDAWAWTRPWDDGPTVRVGLVQPNIPLVQKHDEARDAATSATLAEQTRRAASLGAALVVWPETARPEPLYHRLDLPWSYRMPDVQDLARETRTTVLAGVEYVRLLRNGDYTLYNAALAARPDGSLAPEWAAKVYLVPFVERTPFMPLLGPLLQGDGETMRWLSGSFAPGTTDGILPVGGARAGVMVCYEELYPDLARRLRRSGANLFVVVTNDAWFGRTFFQAYQANALAMRAVESRTSAVRAANTGISGFVDRRGRYRERTGLFVPDVRVADVSLGSGEPTLYVRTGDVVAWTCAMALAALILVLRLRAARESVADSAAGGAA